MLSRLKSTADLNVLGFVRDGRVRLERLETSKFIRARAFIRRKLLRSPQGRRTSVPPSVRRRRGGKNSASETAEGGVPTFQKSLIAPSAKGRLHHAEHHHAAAHRLNPQF